jgi:outer membrane lipopolysaccharide assembly protein LptE/RlpB
MRRLLAVLALATSVGCGYHLIGTSGTLPPKLKKLYIAPFVSQTGRPDLDQRLAEAVSQEWVRRGRFQLVERAEDADAVMTCSLFGLQVNPVRYDDRGRATEYQMGVGADVKLVDRTGEKPVELWHDPRFSRSTSYLVDVNAADYFDQQVLAMEALAKDFARGLVVTILEGF